MASLPVSRSTEESHFYMQLHPCRCGEAEFEWSEHAVVPTTEGLVSRYSGQCGRCSRVRRFEFVLAPQPSPPPPALGGQAPSQIIDPGEFLSAAQSAMATVPADPGQLSDEEFHPARDTVAFAVAAVEEVLKFLPPGADAVPAAALRTALGTRLYAQRPYQFTRLHLTALVDRYRQLLARYDDAGGGDVQLTHRPAD